MGKFICLFQIPKEIRKVIYTTNIIESVHRQFRKLTKTKGAFPNDNSFKICFYGNKNAEKNGQCQCGIGA